MSMRRQPTMQIRVEMMGSGEGDHAQFKRLRDRTPVLAPVVATFTPKVEHPDPEWPTIEVVVDVHPDGRAVVTRVSLVGSLDAPLLSNAVRNYSLDRLASLALPVLRVKSPDEPDTGLTIDIGDGFKYCADDSAGAWDRAVSAVRQRESTDADRLGEVGRLYEAGGVTAVAHQLHRSRSQAYRLIAQARAQGHIKET